MDQFTRALRSSFARALTGGGVRLRRLVAALITASALALVIPVYPQTIRGGKPDLQMNITSSRETKMIQGVKEQTTTAADDTSIRPFTFHASDEALADLKRRVIATKWPERETVNDDTQGVQLATMQKLAEYWAKNYDWRKIEAKLNSYPQFITNIDGLDIHFIHVKSKEKNALPLIITHGWPGSIIEQLKVIGPLTDPVAFGGKAEDAFDVVIPSLPGYGFSAKPTAPGWNPVHIAKAWTILMDRLGYKKFVAQGGDWGNAVSESMALQAPAGLLAISTNMAATVPPDIDAALFAGKTKPTDLSADESRAWDQLAFFYKNGLGY